jgi:putative oxidoreductase
LFRDHSALQAAGQILLGVSFLAAGVRNAGWKFAMHAERMSALGVSSSKLLLVVGFALQFAGSILLLVDYHRTVGASLLIVFTVGASLIFHRWWLIADPLSRHLHVANLLLNFGLIGGLLLVAAI